MRTKDFDPNEEFAYREKCCKRGINPSAYHFLPVKRPPFYKKRVAELYARYKLFPIGMDIQKGFPELGRCIIFIPFTHNLLGEYDDKFFDKKTKEYFAKLINEKAPKRW